MRRVAETEALNLPFIRPIIVVSAHVLTQGLLADEHALALILTTLEKHLDIYRVSGTKYCLVLVIICLVVDFLIFINDSRLKRLTSSKYITTLTFYNHSLYLNIHDSYYCLATR